MRWTVKIIRPAASEDEIPPAEWVFEVSQQRARNAANSSRTVSETLAPIGTIVHVHQCYNDEPGELHQPCVITDSWRRDSATVWTKTL